MIDSSARARSSAPPHPRRSELGQHPVCRTTDEHEFGVQLNALYYPATLTAVPRPRTDAPPAPSVLNAVGSADFTVGYIRPGTDVRVAPDLESTTYHVNLVLRGGLRTTSDAAEFDVVPHRAAVYTAGRLHLVQRWPAGTETIGFKFGQCLVETELEAMLGHPLDRPLVFAPCFELTSSGGRSWEVFVRTLLTELDRPGLAGLPAVRRHLVQSAVAGLLTAAQHSYSAALAAPGRAAPPATVAKVVEYVEEHYAQVLTAGDLAVVAGTGLRRLQEAFADHLDTSPLAHLRDVRLERVRQRLLSDASSSVTEVAYACGFTHLGRFAAAYRARYGEAPSATRGAGAAGGGAVR